jgi:hypothetical protein
MPATLCWTLFFLHACQSGIPKPPPADLPGYFKELHRSVYGVYGLGKDRDAIHGLLEESFSGEALTKEYIEHYTTIFRMEEEETSIDVRQVDYNGVELLSQSLDRLRIDADWSVGGIVTHQKHKHTRVNRYRAVYTLEPTEAGDWKITGTRMRNLERVQRAGLSDEDFFNGTEEGGGYLDPLDLIEGGFLEQ